MGEVALLVKVVRTPYTRRDVEDKQQLSGIIRGFIEALSHIHVSSGREELHVTGPIHTDLQNLANAVARGDVGMLERLTQAVSLDYVENVMYGGSVCVPGSTVKGLLRSRLELCRALNNTSVFCMHSEEAVASLPREGKPGWRHSRIWGSAIFEDRGEFCNPIDSRDYSLCRACDLLGAPGVVGRVMVGNFCCSNCTEHRQLAYGEKIIAIKPGARLEGDIAFTSLSIEELGILFVSMGLTKSSQKGVEILIGKHKYAYRDMGKGSFTVTSVVLPARFKGTVESLGIKCIAEGYTITCRDVELKSLVDTALDRALTSFPQLKNIYGFSEARERDIKGVAV